MDFLRIFWAQFVYFLSCLAHISCLLFMGFPITLAPISKVPLAVEVKEANVKFN